MIDLQGDPGRHWQSCEKNPGYPRHSAEGILWNDLHRSKVSERGMWQDAAYGHDTTGWPGAHHLSASAMAEVKNILRQMDRKWDQVTLLNRYRNKEETPGKPHTDQNMPTVLTETILPRGSLATTLGSYPPVLLEPG